jgi:hypothetical protein
LERLARNTTNTAGRAWPIGNLFKIFYSPGEVFEFPVTEAGWILPLGFTSLLGCLLLLVITNSVDTRAMVRRELESRPELRLGPDEIEKVAQQSDSPSRRIVSYALAVGVPLVVIPTMAGLLTGMLSLFDAKAEFPIVLSVTAYSYYAYYAVTFVLSASVLVLTKDKAGVDVNNLLKTSPRAFLDKSSTSKVFLSLASSVDVLSIAALFLIAFGLSKATARLPLKTALAAVTCLWLLYVAAKAVLSASF